MADGYLFSSKSFTFTSHQCSVNNNEHAQRSLLGSAPVSSCPVIPPNLYNYIILLFMKIISWDPQVTPSLQTAKINNHQVLFQDGGKFAHQLKLTKHSFVWP